MAARGWSTPFDDPIPLPRGRQLVTLKDAGGYIMCGISLWRMSAWGQKAT